MPKFGGRLVEQAVSRNALKIFGTRQSGLTIEGGSGIEPVNGFALYVHHRQLNRVLRQWPIPISPSSIALLSLVRAVPK